MWLDALKSRTQGPSQDDLVIQTGELEVCATKKPKYLVRYIYDMTWIHGDAINF